MFIGYILAGLNLGSNGYISPICRVSLKIEVGTWPWLIDTFIATSDLSISVSSSFLFSAIDSFSASPTSSRMKHYYANPRRACKLSSLVQHGVVQTLDYNIARLDI